MSTEGTAGDDPRLPADRQGGPSVTTFLPPLARLRLALARVPARQALGGVLVLLWAAWLIALWLAQPRLVPPDRLEDDLGRGQITGYAVVRIVEDPPGFFHTGPGSAFEVRPAPEDGRLQLDDPDASSWSPGDGLITIAYWTDSSVADLRVLDLNQTFPGDLSTIADRLDAADVEDRTTTVDYSTFPTGLWNLYGILMLAGLVVVITGPRPGRGNRWFWFWLLGLPLGLGLLALAVLEFLRPPRLVVVPETVTGDDVADGDVTASDEDFTRKRLSGWTGFWANIVGGILITVVVGRLADLMPLFVLRA